MPEGGWCLNEKLHSEANNIITSLTFWLHKIIYIFFSLIKNIYIYIEYSKGAGTSVKKSRVEQII